MYTNRFVTGACIVLGFVALLVSFSYESSVFSFGAAFFFFLSLLLWKYGYLFIPYVTRLTNIIEIRNGYEIPATRDVVLKKHEGGYYASRFLEVKFYESTMDKNEDQKQFLFESFEKTLASVKHVVKISLLLSAVDLSRHIEELKTKRSAAESRRARLSRSTGDDVVKLDREIAMYTRQLDRITRGEKPIELLAYASTTAYGLTREEATQRVARQAKEIQTILSSSLGADVMPLSDREMLRCFEWDIFFPASAEDLKDELF